jgi:hypothetical protein
MQVRCQRCGYKFTLSREAMTTVLQETAEMKTGHYNIECAKCRRQIKVPIKEIKRLQPR